MAPWTTTSTPLLSPDKGHYLPPSQVLPSLRRPLHSGSTYARDLSKTKVTIYLSQKQYLKDSHTLVQTLENSHLPLCKPCRFTSEENMWNSKITNIILLNMKNIIKHWFFLSQPGHNKGVRIDRAIAICCAHRPRPHGPRPQHPCHR